MDSNKILIGFFVGVVVLLAAPIVVKQVRDRQGGTAAPDVSSQAGQPSATGGPSLPPGAPPGVLDPPLLNEANLTNASWQAKVDNYVLKITLAPAGVVLVTNPMLKTLIGMDVIQGSWRVQGDRVYVSFVLGGNQYDLSLKIGGSNLYFIKPDGKISKVERAI
ncbi:MAG TPA: hypothetical protein PK379_00885 [Candidatus Hydrogenedentes bacterium]|nr:hypothetical protein [Candidatus Hydrogenedentota bacterium]